MKRDTRLIINHIKSAYDILITTPLKNPKLYYTYTPYQDTQEAKFICDVTGNEVVISDTTFIGRPYFIIKSDESDDLISATRTIEVDSVDNFRDQGGYKTNSGKYVKWGRFFRGAAFCSLTEGEKKYVDSLGIDTIFDYRDDGERLNSPDYVPKNTILQAIPAFQNFEGKVNLTSFSSIDKTVAKIKTQKNVDEILAGFKSIYMELPFNNSAYAEMFSALDSEDTAHIFQHCSAGKDRTGIGCALLLLALGVNEESVTADYYLSAIYRETANEKYISVLRQIIDNQFAIDCMNRLLSVEEEFIKTSFNSILTKYNDYETFFLKEYGITKERLEHWRSIHLYG